MDLYTMQIIIGICTLIVATFAFIATVTDWFKKRIPVDCGFLINGEIQNKITLSTGDEAKPIKIRCSNKKENTIVGVIIDIKFLKPISLSGTNSALTFIPGKTRHSRSPDKSYYLIRYSELDMLGKKNFDVKVELNTKGKIPGNSHVVINIYSTQKEYKFKKYDLIIEMR